MDAEADCLKLEHKKQRDDFFKQVTAESDESVDTSISSLLEELSSPYYFSHQCSEIDLLASRFLDEDTIRTAVEAAVTDGQFCVSVADPRQPDLPLIAVSDAFEAMTGFDRSEALGKNCRFLNQGCNVNRQEMMVLRNACRTGRSYVGVLTNRRKSGEQFLNLLDLRGLNVARNPRTKEDLWFLIGIQADVTASHLLLPELREDQLLQMHKIADSIRAHLTSELRGFAVAGAMASGGFTLNFTATVLEDDEGNLPDAWCLLPNPAWRSKETPMLPSEMHSRLLASSGRSSLSSRSSLSGASRGSLSGASTPRTPKSARSETSESWKTVASMASSMACGSSQHGEEDPLASLQANRESLLEAARIMEGIGGPSQLRELKKEDVDELQNEVSAASAAPGSTPSICTAVEDTEVEAATGHVTGGNAQQEGVEEKRELVTFSLFPVCFAVSAAVLAVLVSRRFAGRQR